MYIQLYKKKKKNAYPVIMIIIVKYSMNLT